MNEEYRIVVNYPEYEISNTCKMRICGTEKESIKHRDGRHWIRTFEVNHFKDWCLEIEMLKLFPEQRAFYTRDGIKKKDTASQETRQNIKQDFLNGETVTNLSDIYKLNESFIKTIISEIPDKKTSFLSNS